MALRIKVADIFGNEEIAVEPGPVPGEAIVSLVKESSRHASVALTPDEIDLLVDALNNLKRRRR